MFKSTVLISILVSALAVNQTNAIKWKDCFKTRRSDRPNVGQLDPIEYRPASEPSPTKLPEGVEEKVIILKKHVLDTNGIKTIRDFNSKISDKLLVDGGFKHMEKGRFNPSNLPRQLFMKDYFGSFYFADIIRPCASFISHTFSESELAIDHPDHSLTDSERNQYLIGKLCSKFLKNRENLFEKIYSMYLEYHPVQ